MSTSSTGSERRLALRPAARSLRVHLALGFGLLAILLTGALALLIGELATGLARKEIGYHLTRLAIEMRDKLDIGLFERLSEVELLANVDTTLDGPRNAALRQAMLDELGRSSPEYSWLGYVDTQGRVQNSLRGLLVGENVSDRAWFRRGLAGQYVGDVNEAKPLARLIPAAGKDQLRFVDIALPLRNKQGVYGVVAAHVNWRWAEELRDSIESYAPAEAPFELLVVSAQGDVLLGPKELVGTSLPLTELSPSRLRTYDARLERWADGVTYLTGTSATRGHASYPGLGWIVVARQRADFAFAPMRVLQQRIALAGALLALIALAAGWWLASRVSRPLFRIGAAADEISLGRRRVQIPSGGGYTEAEQLSTSLRTMLARLSAQEEDLRQAQDRLEARVRERTAELAKARAEVELESAEHKIASEEAAAAKEQLSLALDASRLALWDYDIASGRVFLSATWSEMVGAPSGPTTTSIDELTELVPGPERAGVARAITAAMKGPQSDYRVEHRVQTAGGEFIWIISEGRVVSRSPDGRALRMLGTNRDISDRVQTRDALRESEARFKGAFENSAIGMAIVGLDGHWLKVNRALGGIVGYSEPELLALRFQDITHADDLDADLQFVREMLEGSRQDYQMEKRYLDKQGREVWVQLNVSMVRDAAGAPLYFISQIQDVSARRRAEEALRDSEARFKGAFENSATGMSMIGLDGRWLKVNRAVCEITGYSEAELLTHTFHDLTHPDDLQMGPASLGELLSGKRETIQIEKRYIHKLGHHVWVLVNLSLVRDKAGNPQHFISQTLDISERRELLQRVEHLALHDPLTGLPNSRLLLDRLELSVAAARRAKRLMGVMYIDLDGFKLVNDTHGHAAGDTVLKECAARMKRVLRQADSVARVGGDEFVALLNEAGGEAEAAAAAGRVLAAIALPFDLEGTQAAISASIGIALYPQHGEDAQSLLQRADAAMYQAKRAGKNSYRFFAGDAQ